MLSSSCAIKDPAGRDPERTIKAYNNLQRFKSELLSIKTTGKVLFAGLCNEEYQKARSGSFSYADCGYPSAIFFPKDTEDLQNIIRGLFPLCRRHPGARISVSGGRHSHNSYVDDAITIDLMNFNAIQPNLAEKWIDVAGGCHLEDVDKALSGTGFGFTTGTYGDTGVGGLTLAGGYGYLGRKYGYACQNVLEMDVVLATGELVTCRDDNEYAPLLQALRGGGGEFGIVVRFRFVLVPVGVSTVFGTVVHVTPGLKSVTEAITSWRDITMSFPVEFGGMLILPIGAPVTVMSGVVFDEKAKSYKDVPSLKALTEDIKGPKFVLQKNWKTGPYTQAQNMLQNVVRRGNLINSGFMLKTLNDEVIKALVHFTRTDIISKGVVLVSLMGGALKEEIRPHCMSYTEAGFWVVFEGSFKGRPTPKKVQTVREWIERFKEALAKADEGGGLNQPAHGFFDSRVKVRAALSAAKQQYDPAGFFSGTDMFGDGLNIEKVTVASV